MMVLPTSIMITILGLAFLSALASTQPVASTYLEVHHTAVDNGFVSVTVRNNSDQAITAWAVRGRIAYEDETSESVEMSAEGFLSGFPREGQPYEHRTFAPGSTVRRRIPTAFKDVPILRVWLVPIAVIFHDGTAVGDERVIARLFENRTRERHALELLEELVSNENATSVNPWADILDIQRRLEEINDVNIRDTLAFKQVVHNLSLAIRIDGQDQSLLRQRLRTIRSETRAKHALARHQHQRRY